MRRSVSVLSSYSHSDSEMETEENSQKRASTSNLGDESRSKRVKASPTKSNLSEKDARKAARMIRNRRKLIFVFPAERVTKFLLERDWTIASLY